MKKNFSKRSSRTNKFNARSCKFGDRVYHSKKECEYAQNLEWLKKVGEVKEWIPQFKLDLRVNGEHICNYYIDFKVIYSNGRIEFVEVKGFETNEWRLKWKLTTALWPKIKGVEKNAELVLYK